MQLHNSKHIWLLFMYKGLHNKLSALKRICYTRRSITQRPLTYSADHRLRCHLLSQWAVTNALRSFYYESLLEIGSDVKYLNFDGISFGWRRFYVHSKVWQMLVASCIFHFLSRGIVCIYKKMKIETFRLCWKQIKQSVLFIVYIEYIFRQLFSFG